MRLFTVGHRELPCAGYHGGPAAQQINIQLLKFKFAHLLAFSLVALAVAGQCGLPSAGFRCAGKEREIGRVPVTLHESLKLAMIPGFDLGEQDVLDAFFKIGALIGGRFSALRIGGELLWARR
jgi:hypothetical protein